MKLCVVLYDRIGGKGALDLSRILGFPRIGNSAFNPERAKANCVQIVLRIIWIRNFRDCCDLDQCMQIASVL
jgi:hypothetical protein